MTETLDFTPDTVLTRDPASLLPHPLNATLYGDEVDAGLKESIREQGILVPLLVTAEGTIISGHQRCAIARELGIDSVPVIISPLADPYEIEEAVIRANIGRVKTNYQKAIEYRELKRIQRELARQRQQAGAVSTNAKLGRKTSATDGEKLPTASRKGRARDLAAEMLGFSGKTAENALLALSAIEERQALGDTDAVQKLMKRFQKGVHSALQTARNQGWLPDSGEQDAKFNRTTDSIDWAAWSWNPVTGCKFGCDYCYARTQALCHTQFYPQGFAPHFRPERLNAPANMGSPTGASRADRSVFVSSMGDMFGDWVPQEWIDQVLEAVRAAPDWTFIFLTKNPARMVPIDWPDNAWVGTTVDRQARVYPAEAAFLNVKATVKFVSCEPFLEELTFSHMDVFDWVLIGGSKPQPNWPEQQPEWTWVTSLLEQARSGGCKVFCKPNLHPHWPREFPSV